MTLSLDIAANLKIVQDNIKKKVEEAIASAKGTFNIGAVGGTEAKGDKESTSILSGILGKVAIVAGFIMAIKPIQQILEIVSGTITFILLKLLAWFGPGKEDPVDKKLDEVKEKMQDLVDQGVITQDQADKAGKTIDILQGTRDFLFKYIPGLELIYNVGVKAWGKLQEIWDSTKELREAIKEKFNELKAKIKEKLSELIKDIKEKVATRIYNLGLKMKAVKDKLVGMWETLKGLPEQIKEKLKEKYDEFIAAIKSIPDKISKAIDNFLSKMKSFLFGGRKKSVKDAIIRPNGDLIETDPRDTLIATQTPGELGGGKTINVTFNGVTPEELITFLKRELGTEIIGGNRF